MDKKKLALFIYSLSGGGAERVVSILTHELKKDYDLYLILMNNTMEYQIPEDTKILYLENSNGKENSIFKIIKLPYLGYKYKRLCKKHNIALSLSFMYRPNFINVFSKIFGNSSKIIISERNTASKTYDGNSLGAKVGRFLVKKLYKKADFIIPNSKGNATDLIQNFEIDSNLIEVIENPIDIKKVELLTKDTQRDNKIFTFINVSRLEKHKGHLGIIKAFQKANLDNTQLLFLGKGSEYEILKDYINTQQLQNQVKLLGFQKNPYEYMKNSDCFILNSSREGFPNVLVEALACDLIVISSDCKSGPKEILAPNLDISSIIEDKYFAEYGVLFPTDDIETLSEILKEIYENKSLQEDYKSVAKKRAQDFEKHKIIDKFKKILT